MTDRTPKRSQTDEELRRAIEDYQWRWTDFKPGEDADMDAEIKRVVDEQMALIQADRERLYTALLSESEDPVDSFGKVVPVDIIKKMFNREGADNG